MKIVQIEMDKTRNVKFGVNAVIEIEKELGQSITEIGENFSLETLRTILLHGLKWEDKKLNQDKVGDLLDEAIGNHGSFPVVAQLVMEAFQSVFGETAAVPSKK